MRLGRLARLCNRIDADTMLKEERSNEAKGLDGLVPEIEDKHAKQGRGVGEHALAQHTSLVDTASNGSYATSSLGGIA